MRNQQVRLTIGITGIAVAIAIVPAMPASAGLAKSSQKSHTKKAKSAAATCPSASKLSTPAGVTYSAPTSQPGFDKGWLVCNYDVNGEDSLQISLYTTGYPLRELSANAAGPTTKVSGIGNAASHFGTIVYVQRNSAPSFSVIDEGGDLTLSQNEGIAKAIVG